MGIPLVSGRPMSAGDSANAMPVVWISRMAAEKYFAGEDPIGKRIALGDQPVWRTIAGVTGNMKHMRLEKEPGPEIYLPLDQFGAGSSEVGVVVRARADPLPLTRPIQAQIAAIDGSLPVSEVRTIDQLLDESTAPQKFYAVLGGAFAALAFMLPMAGLYGVMSYLVGQQTREIGVRMALGAAQRNVFGLVFRQSAAFVLPGLALGLASSFVLVRLLRTYVFGVSLADPAIYLGVTLTLAIVAACATFVPARRAARVDPMVALRSE